MAHHGEHGPRNVLVADGFVYGGIGVLQACGVEAHALRTYALQGLCL